MGWTVEGDALIEVADSATYGYNVEPEEDSTSPRHDCDWLGTMVCDHADYNLGDDEELPDTARVWDSEWQEWTDRECGSWDDVEQALEQREGPLAVCLPLYLYNHSGITMSTSPFSCPWDSGQVGFIYVTKAKVRQVFGVKRISAKLLAKVREQLEDEVKVYDQYLEGDVWYYTVFKHGLEDGEEELVDSCGWIYGYDEAERQAEEAMLARIKEASDELLSKNPWHGGPSHV